MADNKAQSKWHFLLNWFFRSSHRTAIQSMWIASFDKKMISYTNYAHKRKTTLLPVVDSKS